MLRFGLGGDALLVRHTRLGRHGPSIVLKKTETPNHKWQLRRDNNSPTVTGHSAWQDLPGHVTLYRWQCLLCSGGAGPLWRVTAAACGEGGAPPVRVWAAVAA